MVRFKDNSEPFKPKTFKDRFVDLFKKEPLSPLPESRQRTFSDKLFDLFSEPAQEKDYRPLSERGLISPVKEEATGRFPSVAGLKKIPGWATTGTYDKLQALPPEVKQTTTKWQDKILKNFGGDNVPDAMHVMFKESSGRPHITHVNVEGGEGFHREVKSPKELNELIKKYGNVDVGLMQINTIHADKIKERFGYSMADLLDPDKNLEVAGWIFEREGWTPWVGSRKLALEL